jgi:putative oxidoreductase
MPVTLVTEPHTRLPIRAESYSRWSAIPLRLVVGCGIVAHGCAKLSRGPDSFAEVLHTVGIPLPHFMAWLTTLVEIVCGSAVLIGAFIPLVTVPIAIVLLTALATIHLPYGFFSVKIVEVTAAGTKFGPVGYEIILIYLAGLVAIVLNGAGPLSIDHWLSNYARRDHAPFSQRRHLQ